jgi:hypothetical protein
MAQQKKQQQQLEGQPASETRSPARQIPKTKSFVKWGSPNLNLKIVRGKRPPTEGRGGAGGAPDVAAQIVTARRNMWQGIPTPWLTAIVACQIVLSGAVLPREASVSPRGPVSAISASLRMMPRAGDGMHNGAVPVLKLAALGPSSGRELSTLRLRGGGCLDCFSCLGASPTRPAQPVKRPRLYARSALSAASHPPNVERIRCVVCGAVEGVLRKLTVHVVGGGAKTYRRNTRHSLDTSAPKRKRKIRAGRLEKSCDIAAPISKVRRSARRAPRLPAPAASRRRRGRRRRCTL